MYKYTNKKIKSNIWYDRAMKRTFKGKQFTKDQFVHKFISIFLHVEDESNLLNASRRAGYVWSTFTKSGHIIKINS